MFNFPLTKCSQHCVMGRFDHNMVGLENGESNGKPTLKQ